MHAPPALAIASEEERRGAVGAAARHVRKRLHPPARLNVRWRRVPAKIGAVVGARLGARRGGRIGGHHCTRPRGVGRVVSCGHEDTAAHAADDLAFARAAVGTCELLREAIRRERTESDGSARKPINLNRGALQIPSMRGDGFERDAFLRG